MQPRSDINPTHKDIARFFSKLPKQDLSKDQCWEWRGTTSNRNYAYFWIKNSNRVAARICWNIFNANVPLDMNINHHCDNGLCMNPNHLYIGTNKQNSQDMVDRNRSLKGEKHNLAKLTEREVSQIRLLYDIGIKQRIIAEMFNVHRTTVSYIGLRQIWKHL